MSFTYRYPRPMVTVDLLILRFREEKIELLLIQRDRPPYQGKWALPGGFIDMEETLLQSAQRELQEETGLENVSLYQLSSFGDPGRDPRGRTITVLFCGILAPPFPPVTAGDDARRAQWFALNQLPNLAFDHSHVVSSAVRDLKQHLFCRLWLFRFLPESFTTDDLNMLSGAWFGKTARPDLFVEAALVSGLVQKTIDGFRQKTTGKRNYPDVHFPALLSAWSDLVSKGKKGE